MTAVRPRSPHPHRDDESAISFESPREEPPPAPAPSDWQPQLITLLAELEHLRTDLDGRHLVIESTVIVGRMEQMVHAAEELAGRTEFANHLLNEQTEAIARAGAFFTHVSTMKQRKGSVVKSLWASFTGTAKGPTAEEVREALVSAADALNAYFALFTSRFGSSQAASGWVDAASTFLAEFRRLARELPA